MGYIGIGKVRCSFVPVSSFLPRHERLVNKVSITHAPKTKKGREYQPVAKIGKVVMAQSTKRKRIPHATTKLLCMVCARLLFVFALVFSVCSKELRPGEYLSRQVVPNCSVQYTMESLNSVKMSVYLVDQFGYDLYIDSGVVIRYDDECSCVTRTECNVSCQTPQVDNVSQDALYIIITHSLLQTAEYEFTFVDSCVGPLLCFLPFVTVVSLVGPLG